jgi:hypothetical protein
MHIHQLNYMCYRKLCNAVTNKPSNFYTAGQWTLGLCSVAMAGKSSVSKALLMKRQAQFILNNLIIKKLPPG